MDPFFIWVENSWFSVWVRESPSLLAFPFILILHTVGMGFVAGGNGAVALRILGIAPEIPLNQLRRFYPYMWLGFWVNAVSGVALLIGYPAKALTNPDFYLKMMFILLGVVNMWLVGDYVVDQPDAAGRRVLARSTANALRALCAGLGLISAGGIVFLIMNAGSVLTNATSYMRGGLIALGLLNIAAIIINTRAIGALTVKTAPDATSFPIKVLAVSSFVLWAGAITSGRFLAYTYSILKVS